jgi:hypothetical protein
VSNYLLPRAKSLSYGPFGRRFTAIPQGCPHVAQPVL